MTSRRGLGGAPIASGGASASRPRDLAKGDLRAWREVFEVAWLASFEISARFAAGARAPSGDSSEIDGDWRRAAEGPRPETFGDSGSTPRTRSAAYGEASSGCFSAARRPTRARSSAARARAAARWSKAPPLVGVSSSGSPRASPRRTPRRAAPATRRRRVVAARPARQTRRVPPTPPAPPPPCRWPSAAPPPERAA